ncbi:MAG: SDR family oxidoreductase [Pseudomonadota bacterium]
MLDGKRAIITGAASGIGREIATHFAQHGAYVIGTDLNEQGLEETRSALPQGHFEAIAHDVTNPDDWSKVISRAFGDAPCHVLVNNAGIADLASFSQMTLERFQRTNAINLLAPFAGSKMFIEAARKAASPEPAYASIINMTSVAAERVIPGSCAYSTSKGALKNLTKALAVEMGRKGDFIRVNAVAPGPVRTPMTEGVSDVPWEERDHSPLAVIPLQRHGQKSEIAKAVVHLASDKSKFTTGATIHVDGGWSDI